MSLIWILIGLLLVVAGILAVSGFIITKQPRAKELVDKIVPFQGIIGVVLLVLGVIFLISWIGKTDRMSVIDSRWSLFSITIYLATASAILLGFLFGMPLIAKWIPGDSPAEQKALDMQKKVAGLSTFIGIAGLVFGVMLLFYRFRGEGGDAIEFLFH
jgi:hypothetical protein